MPWASIDPIPNSSTSESGILIALKDLVNHHQLIVYVTWRIGGTLGLINSPGSVLREVKQEEESAYKRLS